ncbi:MAG: Fur family transcriptional regulator [Syntrophobacteraceae bacterium]
MIEDGEDLIEMQKALKAAGCRISSQRRAIIEHLASNTTHPSARQILQEVRQKHPDLSLATVYNTLGVLTRLGQIKVMQFDGADNRYEPNVEPHINLICTLCGTIEDLGQSISLGAEKIMSESGFEVFDSRLEFYGLCAKCRAAGRPDLE